MKRLAWIFMLALTSSCAIADETRPMTVAEEARALIGIEYTPRLTGDQITDRLTCTDEGGGLLDNDGMWSHGLAKCQGRWIVILLHAVGKVDVHTTWHITDTLLLPPVEVLWSSERSNALYLSSAEEGACEVRGRPNTYFIALTRWGKRDRIDWRTGVERAWTFDIKHGHIVPLSTKGIVCESIEP